MMISMKIVCLVVAAALCVGGQESNTGISLFLKNPSAVHSAIHKPTTFECRVEGELENQFIIIWYKGKEKMGKIKYDEGYIELDSPDRYVLEWIKYNHTARFTIENTTSDDEGEWSCQYSGSDVYEKKLNVYVTGRLLTYSLFFFRQTSTTPY